MEYLNIVKYFAKFPLKDGVLKNIKQDETPIPGYDALKEYFQNMDPHSLIPEIEDYILTQNDKTLADRIKNSSGWFMLVESGGLSAGALTNVRTRESKTAVQITIARHYDSRGLDSIAESLILDNSQAIAKRLIDLIKADDRENCPQSRWLDNPYQIDPVDPYLLFESIGWQITLTRNYSALL